MEKPLFPGNVAALQEAKTSIVLISAAEWFNVWRGRFGDLSLVGELEKELRARAARIQHAAAATAKIRAAGTAYAPAYLLGAASVLDCIGEERRPTE